jgi:hypothetical protein
VFAGIAVGAAAWEVGAEIFGGGGVVLGGDWNRWNRFVGVSSVYHGMPDEHQTHSNAALNGVTADSAAWISKSVHHKGAAAGMVCDFLVFGLLVWNFSSNFPCFPVRMAGRYLCRFCA